METGFSPIAKNPTAAGGNFGTSEGAFLDLTIIDPERSRIVAVSGYDTEFINRNGIRRVKRRKSFSRAEITYQGVTRDQMTALRSYVELNKDNLSIPFYYDDLLLTGALESEPSVRRITENEYEVAVSVRIKTAVVA